MLNRPARTIHVAYLDGPLEQIGNRWTFVETGDGKCGVAFSIDGAFKNRVLGALMGAMFDLAFRTFAEVFETRADEVYGRKLR